MDYKTLTDEEFEQHRSDLMTELERRNKLRDAPSQALALVEEYGKLGGDKDKLLKELNGNRKWAFEASERALADKVEPTV